MTQSIYTENISWPRRFRVSSIKPYSFSSKALHQLMSEDYPDNVIVRMYFGKVCDKTITEQQFRDRLSELWGANSSYNIVTANATGDRSKVSYIMSIPPNGLIHIPETWPEAPRCSIPGDQKCSAFLQCRVNNPSGALSGVNRQLGTGLPPEPTPECGSGHYWDEQTKECKIISGVETKDEKTPTETVKKEFPWPWVILGGIILTGGILSVVAFNSKSKSESLRSPSEEEDENLVVASY